MDLSTLNTLGVTLVHLGSNQDTQVPPDIKEGFLVHLGSILAFLEHREPTAKTLRLMSK